MGYRLLKLLFLLLILTLLITCGSEEKTLNRPKIYPPSGNYRTTDKIFIESEDQDISLYYTIDNSEPNINSLFYTEPFSLPKGEVTIKAIAVKGDKKSKISFVNYIIEEELVREIKNPIFSIPSGTYSKGTKISIVEQNGENFEIFYTIDLSNPTRESTKFSIPIDLDIGDHTLKAISCDQEECSSIVSATYKIEEDQSLDIYFKKPENWSGNSVYIHYWNTQPNIGSSAWPGNLMENIGNGWYLYSFENLDSLNMVFNNGEGTQTTDLSRDKDGYYVDGVWYSSNPEGGIVVAVEPSVELPNSYSYRDKLTINLKIAGDNIESAKYTVDGSNPKYGTTFNSEGTDITIGENVDPNTITVLKVYGSNGEEELFKTYQYKKIESSTSDLIKKVNNLVIYQIMVEAYRDSDRIPDYDYNDGWGPSSHSGDIQGIIESIPYIKSLGVNAIWITPIFDSEGDGKLDATGYFTKNYFDVDPHFGDKETLKELVDTAHENNLYIFFDGVFGHHKYGDVTPSPNGLTPQGGDNPVDYNQSETLEFYKEVATYWINELGIDGWRLDQAYQVPVWAWKEIRESVENSCQQREESGKTWGTLCYLVGEIWDSAQNIQQKGYGGNGDPIGIKSCFDFPVRYGLVQVFATQEHSDENNAKGRPVSILNDFLNGHNIYAAHAQPNLMLTNHDLVRFGDLIQRAGYGGKENPLYWKRHKAVFSFMAAYTGPITIYYGDEIGREVENFINHGDRGLYDDHASRDDGKVDNFTESENDLKNYLKSILEIRKNHSALYNGERTNIIATDNIYCDIKSDQNEKIVYLLNSSTESKTVEIDQNRVGGTKLKNLENDQIIDSNGSKFTINMSSMSGSFYLVIE